VIVYVDHIDGFFGNMVWCRRKTGPPILLEIEDFQDLVGKAVSVGIAPDGVTTFDPWVLDTLPEWAQRQGAR
jgi:hypothetical protein